MGDDLDPTLRLHDCRQDIASYHRRDEDLVVRGLLQALDMDSDVRERVIHTARGYVEFVRARLKVRPSVNNFLLQFGLGQEDGLALMCLAEALLRIPDEATVDLFIREQIARGNWAAHIGRQSSLFVNATAWGLVCLGGMLGDKDLASGRWRQLLGRISEPVIREALKRSVGLVGNVFVLGESIEEAIGEAEKYSERGYRFSFDMLGEGAKTKSDAQRYFDAYYHAIRRVGQFSYGKNSRVGHGISVKLSALHPRYEWAQRDRVLRELVPLVYDLAVLCKQQNIGLTVDAEESDRLDLMLDVFTAVYQKDALGGWDGLGLAVQAYQKRALPVLGYLVELARVGGRRIPIRLVKGAYWDAEVKRCQELGLDDYPVFTRKTNTDISYLACARFMLAHAGQLYSAFATHNAYSVAAILAMAGDFRDFEFQRLHGMGEELYDHVLEADSTVACRVYAPVGNHRSLLAYLVRRLLENGANSSFVYQIADPKISPDAVVRDPALDVLARPSSCRSDAIPLPVNMFGKRRNSLGCDYSDEAERNHISLQLKAAGGLGIYAGSIVAGTVYCDESAAPMLSPIDQSIALGAWSQASNALVDNALTSAISAFDAWSRTPIALRAQYLDSVADLFERDKDYFITLLVHEAGKTIVNALGEVRETVDFCRYYACIARDEMSETITLTGPTGEQNLLSLSGKGVFCCISPWNFPLAIFVGQVAAALVAGNCVIAKPAEQTPLIAFEAVKRFHAAGVPVDVMHLLLGCGEDVGHVLVSDPRVAGVMFTGSTDVARTINLSLAQRAGPIATLVAETGGINTMIVDSTALPEQVVADVLTSAFDSAGQRCSALRVLFLQEDIASKVIEQLRGAMQELVVGDPGIFATDIGPVIDADALRRLTDHVAFLNTNGRLLASVPMPHGLKNGNYFAPRMYAIDRLSLLKDETFGPILHVLTFKASELDSTVDAINNLGYGLTFGVHSRMDATIQRVVKRIRAGNIYVNRNMIGAVVGVQPFGGLGMSGTGPKAGGPHYLQRLVAERTVCTNTAAIGGNATLLMTSFDEKMDDKV